MTDRAKASLQQTKDQQRAAKAWEYVQSVKKRKDENYEDKYGSWVKKLPALILTNGLGQTLAFLKAKGRNGGAVQELYNHLSEWTMREVAHKNGSLLEWLLEQNSTTYRRATTEALAFINWLKRFAEAELKIENKENS